MRNEIKSKSRDGEARVGIRSDPKFFFEEKASLAGKSRAAPALSGDNSGVVWEQ
jgi:hypothetical protein